MEQLLASFGCSPPEIKVYEALIQHGGATVSELAQRCGIKRTSCQELVQSLKSQGLVYGSQHGSRAQYSAEDPDRLLQLVHEREYAVDRLLPVLEAYRKRPDVWEARRLTSDDGRQLFVQQKRQGAIALEGRITGTLLRDRLIFLINEPNLPAASIRSAGIAALTVELLKGQE